MKVTYAFRARLKPRKPASRVARMLALAHHVDRLIEAGDIGSYADAAAALGLTRARVTQLMKLTLLSPEIQGRLLTAELTTAERWMRPVVSEANWQKQLAVMAESSNQ